MLVTVGQFRAITSAGVDDVTAVLAIDAWLSHRRPYEVQRILSRAVSGEDATAIVGALSKTDIRRKS